MKSFLLTIVFTTILVSSGIGQDKTLSNLQQAYQEEANAERRYELYSEKALLDGYYDIAELFCAAATSENIHKNNHKDVIEKIGSQAPAIELEDVTIQSTAENLKESITDERIETKFTYPHYIEDALSEHLGEAVQSFMFAKETEEKHVQLFRHALTNINNNIPEDYYVSTKTGEPIEVREFSAAPKPRYEGEEFIEIQKY